MILLNLSAILLENFSAIIATSGTLIGAFLGYIFTRKTQNDSFDKQLAWEQEKREIDKLEELTMIYNRILKVDGEKEVIDYNRGNKIELQTEIYIGEIRPILFEKFHLLHSDVASIVKEIDEVLVKWSVLEEEGYDGESEYIAGRYLDMINKINSYVDLLRVK